MGDTSAYAAATSRDDREKYVGHGAFPQCAAGFYCTSGAASTHPYVERGGFEGPCPAGSYCGAGTETPTKCPSGTWSPQRRATSPDYCLECPPGYDCESADGGLVEATTMCAKGVRCTTTYNSGTPAATLDRQQCTSTGKYCPLASHLELYCPTGYYWAGSAQGNCLRCPDGSVCEFGAAAKCARGYYCPNKN